MMEGWIKIHRKILETQLYPKNRQFTKFEAWLDLLLIVNFKDVDTLLGNEVYQCKRGQSIRSIETYQKRWNWTRGQVRSFFNVLEKLSMINLETTNKTTILTICKYDDYQIEQPTDNQRITNEQPTDNQRITTKEERKERKEENMVKKQPFSPPSLQDLQYYFSEKIKEKGLSLNPIIEAEKFEAFYASKNWMVGKNKMADWKKAVTGWINRDISSHGINGSPQNQSVSATQKDLTGLW